MSKQNYWLGLFTGTSWNEFLSSKKHQIGFNEKQIKQAQKIKPKDIIIGYLTKVGSFVSILEATGYAIISSEKKWSEGVFPVRVDTKPIVKVPIPLSVPIRMLLPELSFSKNGQLKSPNAWTSHVRSSPRAWKKEDAELIKSYLLKQIKSPQYFVNSTKIDNIIPRKPSKNIIQNRVGRLNRRTKKGDFNLEKGFQTKRVLSRNKVTGYAVNFPIQKTCRPTKVCRDTCYFAAGLNATSPALTLQHRNLSHCISDPKSFAQRVIYEYDNAGINYLRWNGGGDLFEEALIAIEYIRSNRPDLILWIVSRKPEFASRITYHKNHFIHISLDRSSFFQKAQIRSMFRHKNIFFSYQVHPEEELTEEVISKNKLIFMHDYAAPPKVFEKTDKEKFCPLNGAVSIVNKCNECRQCFDGSFISSG